MRGSRTIGGERKLHFAGAYSGSNARNIVPIRDVSGKRLWR
jgi:hypothetical protein